MLRFGRRSDRRMICRHFGNRFAAPFSDALAQYAFYFSRWIQAKQPLPANSRKLRVTTIERADSAVKQCLRIVFIDFQSAFEQRCNTTLYRAASTCQQALAERYQRCGILSPIEHYGTLKSCYRALEIANRHVRPTQQYPAFQVIRIVIEPLCQVDEHIVNCRYLATAWRCVWSTASLIETSRYPDNYNDGDNNYWRQFLLLPE